MYYPHFSSEEYDAENHRIHHTANGKAEVQTSAFSTGWAEERVNKALNSESSTGPLEFQQSYLFLRCYICQYQSLINLRNKIVFQIL